MENNKEKTIEELYQKLTQREHILKRPDTYVGSIELQPSDMWVVDLDSKEFKMVRKTIQYVPAFLKVFDEILTNASDHAQRVAGVKKIHVELNEDYIIVENDGPGIHVEKHKTENLWVPEMIFGHLLTGTNYNDNEERYGAGRNGYGAKLTNIFSKEFIVETGDGINTYYQKWTDNMENTTDARIRKNGKSFTRISFKPDFERFGMQGLTPELKQLLHKRVADIAVYNPGVKVSCDDRNYTVKNLKEYALAHTQEDKELYYEKINDFWEIAVTETPVDGFEQVSIVNGNATVKGGTHVNYWSLQLSQALQEAVTKGRKDLKVKWFDIKNKFMIFVVCRVPNPTFDTQTKETLTLRMSSEILKGGEISEGFIKKVLKSSIMEAVLEWVRAKELVELQKMNKADRFNRIKVAKLDDANKAGTEESHKAALFLSEGDCMLETDKVSIIRNGLLIDEEIRNLTNEDFVVTHEGTIKPIIDKSSKVAECFKIKTAEGEINCTSTHRIWVYDTEFDKYEFIEAGKLIKSKHKLIKNKISQVKHIEEVLDSNIINDPQYDIELTISNDKVNATIDHKFGVLNIDTLAFEMKKAQDIRPEMDFLIVF